MRVASDREIIHRDEADYVFRIDDEGGALRHSFFRIEDAELFAKLALHIGQHGEGKRLEVLMMLAPCQVDKFGIRAAAQNLRVTVFEFAVEFAECRNLSGADKRKIF